MNEKIKQVIRLAALVVERRDGDVSTEDGCFATTDIDTMIGLETAICSAFETKSDDVSLAEIEYQIAAL